MLGSGEWNNVIWVSWNVWIIEYKIGNNTLTPLSLQGYYVPVRNHWAFPEDSPNRHDRFLILWDRVVLKVGHSDEYLRNIYISLIAYIIVIGKRPYITLVELIRFRSSDGDLYHPSRYLQHSYRVPGFTVCPIHGSLITYALVLHVDLPHLPPHVDVSPLSLAIRPLAPVHLAEDMGAIRNGLKNLDSDMTGVIQQVAGLANFRPQIDTHLQNITASLTCHNRFQSAALLPNPSFGHTGQNTQRCIHDISLYPQYTPKTYR